MPASDVGFVQFTIGDGCPCGSGERRIIYRKLHHRFNNYPGGGFLNPGGNWLAMVGSGWPESMSHLNASVTLGRLTGVASASWGAFLEPPWGVDDVGHDYVTYRAGDLTGRVDFSDEYTLEELFDDLGDVVDDLDMSILYIPWNETWVAGLAEATEEWTATGFPIGSAPADGRHVMQWEADGAGLVDTGFREIALRTTMWWGAYVERQNLQARFIGHFSLQRTDLVEFDDGSPEEETVGPKRYFYLTGGTYDLWSPSTDGAFASLCAETPYRVQSWEYLRIGEHPPEGETATEIAGVGGLGGGGC